MNLHWYGWVGLIICGAFALHDTENLISNAWRHSYAPYNATWLGIWWTATLAILIAGATP